MLEALKKLLTNEVDLTDNTLNFNRTQLVLSIENNYDALSNYRFTNQHDYQKKRKNILTSMSGTDKIVKLVNRFVV